MTLLGLEVQELQLHYLLTAGFPTSGTIKVGAEFISYTGISTNDLTGITRAVAGTRSAHVKWSFC